MNDIELEEFESDRNEGDEEYGDAEAFYRDERPEARRTRLSPQDLARLRDRRSRTARRAPISRPTAAATRIMELERQVRSLSRATAASAKSADRAGWGLAGVAVMGQFFGLFPNAVTGNLPKAALQLSPVFLLAPQKHGSGPLAVLRDQRVAATLVSAGLLAARQVKVFHRPADFTVSGGDIPHGSNTVQLRAVRLDNTGNVVDVPGVTWGSLTPTKATVDPIKGLVTQVGSQTGQVSITAVADGVVKIATINIVP